MKSNCIFIKIVIFLLILLITINTPYSSLAKEIDTDITGRNFKEFNPNKEDDKVNEMAKPINNIIIDIVREVLGILRLFSGFIMVISLALFGLYRVLAANTELTKDVGIQNIAPKNSKALMDAGRAFVIGSILVFSSSAIVEFIMSLFLW